MKQNDSDFLLSNKNVNNSDFLKQMKMTRSIGVPWPLFDGARLLKQLVYICYTINSMDIEHILYLLNLKKNTQMFSTKMP